MASRTDKQHAGGSSRRLLIVLAVALVAMLALSLRPVPADSVALRDSALRGTAVMSPGWHLRVPGLESLQVIEKMERHERVLYTTPEGASLEVRADFVLLPSTDGLRRLLAAGTRDGDDPFAGAFDRAIVEALESTLSGDEAIPTLDGDSRNAVANALGSFGRVEGPVELGYDESSPVLLALRQAEGRAELRRLSRDGSKVLVVGLDGADWQLADPLIAAGKLPHLERLKRRAAWGNVKALVPVLSPLLWTSIATGVTADRHGVVDFLVVDPVTGEKVPVNSRFRKVRAWWNQFTDAGRTADVVAWWATWPAEPVNGHLISDRVSYSLWDYDLPSGGSGATYPPAYFDEVRERLIGDDAISFEEVARFADITREEFDAARALIESDRSNAYKHPVNHLTKILASQRNYHAIALDLIGRGQADLTAVYYQGIDEVCHRFIHFAPPKLQGVDADDVRRYGRVVERYYAYQDELLGELLAAVERDTTVVLTADHGFVNGPDRPQNETADIEGKPGAWHRQYGTFLMAGPHIVSQELDTVSMLDLHPTVLYLAGLPVPEDGEGRVLEEAIDPRYRERFEPATIASYEFAPFRVDAAPTGGMAAADAEMLENLRSLGYIGDIDLEGDEEGVEVAAGGAAVTAYTNLAAVLLAAGDVEAAEAEVEKALAAAPDYATALKQKFGILEHRGALDEALELSDRLMKTEAGTNPVFLARVARVYEKAERTDEGIERFRAAVAGGSPMFGVPLSRLLMGRGDLDGADAAARHVLERDVLNPSAMATVVQIAQQRGRLDSVEPLVQRALQVNPRSVMHLNWMAIVREADGDFQAAEKLLRNALQIDPDHGGSMANLGAFLGRHGKAEEAVPLLERALRIEPGNVQARVNLGTAFGRLGRLGEAIEQFEIAVDGGLEQTVVYNALARAYGQQGDLETAAGWLERSLELDPSQEQVRQMLEQLGATG